MARIPDEVLARVKAECSLVELVIAAGVELRRVGADWHGRCPFHDDRTPSLVVTPEKGLWHCLGACSVGGSVIDCVVRSRVMSFRHAVELLREGLPATTGPAAAGPVASSRLRVRPLAAPVEADAEDVEVLGQVVAFYVRILTESPETLAYLRRRKVDDPDVITEFRLGHANRTLGLRLPRRETVTGAALRGRLQTLGCSARAGTST